jgi:chorismate dehydratase
LKKKILKIGKIPYANLFPTFYFLQNRCDLSEYRFIEGIPSKLNTMLREGKLDISPSSSIEFLKNKTGYRVLPWFSISSSGPIGSILLFSRHPLNRLKGKIIGVSEDSDTSAVLLKIILREFFSLRCRFKTLKHSRDEDLSPFSAFLLIGDKAMKEAKKHSLPGSRKRVHPDLHVLGPGCFPHRYDLGEVWHQQTGLPFVFALWIVRKSVISRKTALLEKFSKDLIDAGKYTRNRLPSIAREAPQREWLGIRDLVKYWKTISYDFTDKHLEGFRLFEYYARKNRFIP